MRSRLRKPLVLVLVVLLHSVGGGTVGANGWVHASIPADYLRRALDAGDARARQSAARALGLRREAWAVPLLVAVLGRPQEPVSVKIEIIEALGNIADSRAVSPLIEALGGAEESAVRAAAAQALGMLRAPEALEPLLEVLKAEPDLAVRMNVLAALGRLDPGRVTDVVLSYLDPGRASSLRIAAVRSLGELGVPAAVTPLLRTLEATSNQQLRREIVISLGAIGDKRAAPPLAELLAAAGASEPLQVAATTALGRIRDGSAVPSLLPLLRSQSPQLRLLAIQALGNIGDSASVEPLSELYGELSAPFASKRSIDRMAEPRAVTLNRLRTAVLRSLQQLSPAEGAPVFMRAVRSTSFPLASLHSPMVAASLYQVRRRAIVALGYSRARASSAFILEEGLLEDEDFRIRAAAVRSLGILGYPHATVPLIGKLDDEVAQVRWESAIVLGRLADQRAVGPLVSRLQDPSSEVVVRSLESLAFLEDPRAASAIEAFLQSDPGPTVRDVAEETLTYLRERAAPGP